MHFFKDFPRFVAMACIRLYQKTFSFDHGFLKFLFPHGFCRFHPTCSDYAYGMIKKHGVLKGGVLAVWRVLRCNPFSKGGNDPVV